MAWRERARTVFSALFKLVPEEARNFWKGVVPLLLALTLSSASNYIFHIAVSRLLGPAAYGGLTALLAILLILSVPVGVIQTVVAKKTAVLRAEGQGEAISPMVSATGRTLLRISVPILIGLVAVSPWIGNFLHIGISSAALVGPYAVLAALTAIPLGVLQGDLDFGALAWVSIFGVGVRLA